MLFETSEQFEQRLKRFASHIDQTGELAELVIDYLNHKEPIEEFVSWLKAKGTRIPYAKMLLEPRYGNLPVDLVGDSAYKYFCGAPDIEPIDERSGANALLYEVSYYLAIVTTVLFAEEKGVVWEGLSERFMTITDIFYVDLGECSDYCLDFCPGQSPQFGYVSKRLDVPCSATSLLKEAIRLFKDFEKLTNYGVHLVHGDFKLDNVLVSKSGGLCLIDFGMATIHIKFGDGTSLNSRWKQKAQDLMYIDPLLFAITYCNSTGMPPTKRDYFDLLECYEDQGEFIEDMYEIAYTYFYRYHRKKPFFFEIYFSEYLKLKK